MLLTQSPLLPSISTLTISIHCKCSLHTLMSRTHYYWSSFLRCLSLLYTVCCRISSCIYMCPSFCRISCGIFRMWNQINGLIPQIFCFREGLQCHLEQKYYFISSFTAWFLAPNFLGMGLQFICSLQGKYSFCIMTTTYNTILLHNTATACSYPAVGERSYPGRVTCLLSAILKPCAGVRLLLKTHLDFQILGQIWRQAAKCQCLSSGS